MGLFLLAHIFALKNLRKTYLIFFILGGIALEIPFILHGHFFALIFNGIMIMIDIIAFLGEIKNNRVLDK